MLAVMYANRKHNTGSRVRFAPVGYLFSGVGELKYIAEMKVGHLS